MIRAIAVLGLFLVADHAVAQNQVKTENGSMAHLRALDTLTGSVTDLDVAVGDTQKYERLMITVKDCRYPEGNPNGDAFAYLEIKDVREDEARFNAWMVASSPALSALEHPRYDVWLLSCKTSEG